MPRMRSSGFYRFPLAEDAYHQDRSDHDPPTPLAFSDGLSGATLMAFTIGGSLAWLVIRTDLPGRNLINVLAVILHHALLDNCDGLESDVQQRHHWRHSWNVDVFDGDAAARLAGLWSPSDHRQQRSALLYLLLSFRIGGVDLDRLQPRRSRRNSRCQPRPHFG